MHREIFINARQDYENPVQRRYEFQIVIENDASVTEPGTILIVTKNLFDNDPSITYEGPCVAPVYTFYCLKQNRRIFH